METELVAIKTGKRGQVFKHNQVILSQISFTGLVRPATDCLEEKSLRSLFGGKKKKLKK